MITCACVRTRRMVGKISAQSHTFVVHAVISYYLAVLHTKWICHFQIPQNTPCLYSQILHNLNVFNFPGFYSCTKRNKRKCSWEILGGKQGVLCIVQAASRVKIYMNNNNNAPINVNPVGRGGGEVSAWGRDFMQETIPPSLSGFWLLEATRGPGVGTFDFDRQKLGINSEAVTKY